MTSLTPFKCVIPVECLEIVLAEYCEMFRDGIGERKSSLSRPESPASTPILITPLLQTCSLIRDLVLPTLYKDITFSTHSSYLSFLKQPFIPNYRYVQAMQTRYRHQSGSNFNVDPFPEREEYEFMETFGRRVRWCNGSVSGGKENQRNEDGSSLNLNLITVGENASVPLAIGSLIKSKNVSFQGFAHFSPHWLSFQPNLQRITFNNPENLYNLEFWVRNLRASIPRIGTLRYEEQLVYPSTITSRTDANATANAKALRLDLDCTITRMAALDHLVASEGIEKVEISIPGLPHAFCYRKEFDKQDEEGVWGEWRRRPKVGRVRSCLGYCEKDEEESGLEVIGEG